MPAGVFFMDGTPVPVAAHVLTHQDTRLLFPTTTKRRRTSCVCLHWTGSENAPSDVYRNMKAVSYSVHFVIDQAGMIYQMADTSALCAHAQGINDRAVGIEIINRGSDFKVPDKGIQRDMVHEKIHGEPVAYRDFLPAQVQSAVALCEALCDAYELPLTVPMEDEHVRANALTKAELVTYRGVLGHMHTKKGKVDPGTRILRAVRARAQAARAGRLTS